MLGVAHLLGCLYHFPPSEIFSGEPALSSDYVIHYLTAIDAAHNLRHGSFLGYTTRWAAGAPSGFLSLVNDRPLSLILAVTPDHQAPLVFNLGVFAALVVTPLLIFPATRAVGAGPAESAAATACFLAAWYGSSLIRVFWRGGSVMFLLGTTLALYVALLLPTLWRRSHSKWTDVRVGLLVAGVGWVHTLCLIVVAVVGAFAWLTIDRAQRRPPISRLLLAGGVALVACAPFLWAFAASAALRRSLDYGVYVGGLETLWFDFTQSFTRQGWRRPETTVLGPLALAALCGAAVGGGTGSERRALWLSAGVFLALAAFAGRFDALRSLQPYRFVIPLAAILAILASPLVRLSERRALVPAIAGTLALLLLADRVRIGRLATDYIAAGLGPADRWTLDTLRGLTQGKRDGRILAEGDWRVEPVPNGHGVRVSYTSVGLSRELDAEFIGAPAMATGLRVEFASFWRGALFGKAIEQYDGDSLRGLCDLYDVRWIVSAREATRRHLASLAPAVVPRAARGAVAVFEVPRTPSRLLRGEGRATGDGEAIEFEASAASAAVLKYHWIPGLRAEPPAELRPLRVIPGAPVEFIEIRPPKPGTYRISWRGSSAAAVDASP